VKDARRFVLIRINLKMLQELKYKALQLPLKRVIVD
jgi:hypothetical protein